MKKQKITQDMIDLNNGAKAYEQGDYETAVRLYEKSAKAGNITAISNLGYCHYYGRSIPVNKMRAKELWEIASKANDVPALYKLGDMYRNGDLEQNLKKSYSYYKKAFNLSKKTDDIDSYPDICMRMVKYLPDQLTEDEKDFYINKAIDGFQQRIELGNPFSTKLLNEMISIKKERAVKKYNGHFDYIAFQNQFTKFCFFLEDPRIMNKDFVKIHDDMIDNLIANEAESIAFFKKQTDLKFLILTAGLKNLIILTQNEKFIEAFETLAHKFENAGPAEFFIEEAKHYLLPK